MNECLKELSIQEMAKPMQMLFWPQVVPAVQTGDFKKIPRLLTNLKSRSTVPLRVSNGITVDLRDPSRHSHIILNMISVKVNKVKKSFTKLYLIPEYETISTDLSVVTLVNHSISTGILSLKLFNAAE